MDHIVVDVEIQNTIDQVGGWDATEKMGVAVACVWQYRGQRMRIYGPEDVPALRERLLAADRISGYNILNFDFPVIWGVEKQRWINDASVGVEQHRYGLRRHLMERTDDLLRRIWRAQGFDPDRWQAGMGGTKLDDVAGATLGTHKIGNGADAPKWYQAGLVQRVANYCADDVALERDLCDFVERYGYVLLRNKMYNLGTGKDQYNYERLELPPWAPGSA